MSHAVRLVLVDLTLVLGLITVTGIATIWGVHARTAWRAGYRLRSVGWAFAALFCLASLVVVAGSALELAGVDLSRRARIVHIVAYFSVVASLVAPLRAAAWLFEPRPQMSERMRRAASLVDLAR